MRKLVLILLFLAFMGIVFSGCGGNNTQSNTLNTYTVTGQITRQDNGLPVDGVTLSFSNGQTVTTGPDGSWRKKGLSGTITVTPFREGWAFEPQNRQLKMGGINANFTAKNASGTTYSVSGKIINQSGDGIGSVLLTFSAGFGTATTGSDGAWSKDGLWGRMSVTPAKNGWAFTPDSQNLSGQANNINFAGQPGVPPSAEPTNLVASIISSSQVALTWTDNSDNESGFKIERKLRTNGTYIQLSTVAAGITSFQDSGLVPCTPYYYRVRAYNAYGDSGYSNEICVTTQVETFSDIPWPKFRGNQKNTGQSQYLAAQGNQLKWECYTSVWSSSPAIDAYGTIYVGDWSGKLTAINPDGSIKWAYPTGDCIWDSSPAIGLDGTIYIGSWDGNLYAVNPNNTLKWSYHTGGWVESPPVIGSDGTIYVGSNDFNLYAISSDGSLKWKYTTENAVESSPAIGSDGTIYVGSCDRNLYAINPDGSLKWKYTTGDLIYSSPAIGSDGTIYIGSEDDNLYAINPNGSFKWKYTTGENVNSPAIGSDGTIYVGSSDGNLYAINPDSSLKWKYITDGPIWSSPAIGSDGTIYIGSSIDKFYAINPDNTLKWSYSLGGISSSPAIGSDGTVYVSQSKIYAFGN
ncbi:MAG TPA: PQQ-binding-like beta-propeller repeat protein [Bacillota bacterium]|nr:PQQ-binding-like beta-propeller repeat protein [Bacillota bacterium]